MHLDKTMESFYMSILDYAGLKVDEDNNIVNQNLDMGAFTLDDSPIALPYFELMKNPEGRKFFHLLNENYANPETVLFNLFKRRLTLELNLRLAQLVTSLIALASDPKKQQRINNPELVELVTSIGEVDYSILEAFMNMCVASKKVNDVGYIFDFYLKKNGTVGDTPYSAICKTNHKLYNEVNKALEKEGDDRFKVYGTKVRKKDLVAIMATMEAIFPTIVLDDDSMVDGTDNKIFRYLNVLLITSHITASRMNEIADMLEEVKDDTLLLEDIRSNLDWVGNLETLYGMAKEIRLIPNQNDIKLEGKKLALDESAAKQVLEQQQVSAKQQLAEPLAPTPQPQPVEQPVQQVPTFNPQAVQQQVQQPQPMPQQQQPMSAEDIIRGRVQQQFQQPMMNQQVPQYQQPMMQQQAPMPGWMQRELMQQQTPQQQQILQQQLMQQQMLQQQQQQAMGYQQPMGMNPMVGHQQPMQGMQINPQMMSRATAPWQ